MLLYIHIPFCRSICGYCDFCRTANLSRLPQTVAMLRDEIVRRVPVDNRLRTIYFGGGTPSLLTPAQFVELLEAINDHYDTSTVEEFTIEANPDDITPQYAEALRSMGIDRVSLGVQSFIDDHLKLMNRRHTASQTTQAVITLRAAGFENITIDLIYGMPFMTPEQWSQNVKMAVNIGVEHISAYHLTIEPGSIFAKRGMEPVSDERSESDFEVLREVLTASGFEHYEVSNFAQPTRRARHNSGYWSGEPYVGIGPGAHSFDGVATRSWNVSSVPAYLAGAPAEVENLTPEQRHNELIITGLRTSDGVSIEILRPQDTQIEAKVRPLISQGLIMLEDNVLRIPAQKFLLSDLVIEKLILG